MSVVRVVLVSAGVICLVLGGVSGVAFLVGLGAMTAPAMIVVAITTAGFLTAGAVLVAHAHAHAHRPEPPPVVVEWPRFRPHRSEDVDAASRVRTPVIVVLVPPFSRHRYRRAV
ncbi:hypothetical protein [Rhodococcus opacus]|uniref:hypothetical protein n=1 Tax=Rhodococcus opacus TaxID=37919 RepID=UPI002236A4A1|nr:hypothetical protein [Rhodococcus opacus]UZG60414.1 hypothetical protein ONE62_42935 [Rhodococcus opacus]